MKLSVDDACGLIGILIGMLPLARELGVRGAMSDSVMRWPETDWDAVVRALRDPNGPEQDAWKIADWLEEEVAQERERWPTGRR